MGNFDRPKPKRTPTPIPSRLRRLDRELLVTRVKEFDYLRFVGKDLKIRFCVMRDEDNKCWATAQLGGRAIKAGGGSASGAVFMLRIALKVAYAQMTEEKKAAVRSSLENSRHELVSKDVQPDTGGAER